jgi:hypothetical protein
VELEVSLGLEVELKLEATLTATTSARFALIAAMKALACCLYAVPLGWKDRKVIFETGGVYVIEST